MDIAHLGILVDSDGVELAARRLSELRRAAGAGGDGIDRVAKSADSARASVGGLAASLAGLAAGALSIGAAADAWIKYDEATRNAANLTGAALGDIKTMADESAAAFGRFGADVAAAFGVVGSKTPALLENADALKAVTEQSLELADAATATGDAMSDADAAGAITAGLNQWSVAASDAAEQADRFGNVLAAGAMYGSASISSMVESMKASGTVAASAGISIEDYAATLQIMASKQIEGAEAGTALRNVISTLLTKGKDFEEFGISAASVNPKIVGIQTALENLSPILQNDIAMTKLFGAENMVAAKILGDNAAAVSDMSAKLTGTTTAYDQAQAGLATFSRQAEMLGANLQNLSAISIDELIGPALAPALTAVNSALISMTETIRELAEIDWSPLLRVIGVGGAIWAGVTLFPTLATAATAVATGFMAIATGAIPLNAALWGTSLAATAATGALGVLKIAGGALFAAWAGWELGTWAYDQFGAVRMAGAAAVGAVFKGFEYLKFGALAVFNEIAYAFGNTIASILDIWANFLQKFANGLNAIGAADIAANVSRAASAITSAGDAARAWGSDTAKLRGEMESNIAAIDDNVQSLFDYEMGLGGASDAAKEVQKSAVQAAGGTAVLADSTAKASAKLKDMDDKAKRVGESLGRLFDKFNKGMSFGDLGAAFKKAADQVKAEDDALTQYILDSQKALANEVDSVWQGVADGLVSAFSGVGKVLSGNVADMKAGAGSMAASLQSAFGARTMAGGASALGMSSLAASLSKQGMLGGVSDDAIFTALNSMGKFGEAVTSGISAIGGMTNALGIASAGLSLLSGDVGGAVSGILGVGGSALGTAIAGPIGGAIGSALGSALGGLFGGGGRTQTGVGIEGAIVGAGTTGGRFADEGIRSFTLEQSNRKGTVGRYGNDAATALEDEITAFATGLQDQVAALGTFFGQDLLPRFNEQFTAAFDIEAATPEELQQKLAAFYANTTTQALQTAAAQIDPTVLDGLELALYDVWQQAGFAADALPAISLGIEQSAWYMSQLGIQSDLLTSSLIQSAGGLDSLQAGLDYFYSQFIPEAMRHDLQLADANAQLLATFQALNMTVPATRAEFIGLVQAMQAGSEAELAAVLSVAQAADVVYRDTETTVARAIDTARAPVESFSRSMDAMGESAANMRNNLLDVAGDLNDWLFTQATGADSALTFAEQFAIANEEFQRVQADAFAGNAEAAQKLTGVADVLLELNRQGYGAGGAGFEAGVRAQVGAVAQKFGGGTSPVFTTPQMPILPQQQQPGAPVVNVTNNNAELIQLLRALLEAERNGSIDVVAGLTKIERAIGARDRVRA